MVVQQVYMIRWPHGSRNGDRSQAGRFIAMILAMALITYIPALSLWLPRLLGL